MVQFSIYVAMASYNNSLNDVLIMINKKMFDLTWGDNVMDVTSDANFMN